MRTSVLHVAACLLAGACVLGTANARAQDAVTRPYSLFSDADFVNGTVGGTSFMKGGLGAGLRIDFTCRASVYIGLRAGFLRLRVDQPLAQGLGGDGEFWGMMEPSGRFGGAYALLRNRTFRLSLIGELEVSLPGSALSATRMRLTTNDGQYDITKYASTDVHPALFWGRLSVGAAFSAKFGHVEPSLSVSFERLDATIDLRLSQDAAASLRALGFAQQKVEREYSVHQGTWIVPIRPSVGWRFDESDVLGIGGTIAPVGPLLGANLVFSHSW